MRPRALLFLLLTVAPTTAPAVLLPGDVANGQRLHDRQCVACHDTRAYTRAERRVKGVEGLMGRVRMCNQQLNANLSRDQLNDIVRYLNETFYKFP